jgi:hypothetical protein
MPVAEGANDGVDGRVDSDDGSVGVSTGARPGGFSDSGCVGSVFNVTGADGASVWGSVELTVVVSDKDSVWRGVKAVLSVTAALSETAKVRNVTTRRITHTVRRSVLQLVGRELDLRTTQR